MMSLRVLIAGGGKVGTYLANLLAGDEHQVFVIEDTITEMPRIEEEIPPDLLVRGNPADPTILDSAGIQNADVVAAVTRSDELNLVIASLSKFEFRVPRVIARVNTPKNAWLFTPHMGVDVALNQADLIAHLIAEEMSVGDMMTLLKLRKGQYSLVENKVQMGSKAAGKAVWELDLPSECILTAIIRGGDLLIPRGNTILSPGDEVLAVVHRSELERLAALMQVSSSPGYTYDNDR